MPFEKLASALKQASLALSASHGLTVTDRSDLPRDQWPVYVLNHTNELALIDAALLGLTSSDNDRECGRCKTTPSKLSA